MRQVVYYHNQTLITLGRRITRAKIFSWKEYINFHRFEKKSDLLSVLKIASEIFNGDLKGFANLPD